MRILSMLALIGLLVPCSAPPASAPAEPASPALQPAAQRAAPRDPARPQAAAAGATRAADQKRAREEDEPDYDERILEFEPGRLGRGVFVVATPSLATSMFAETVILITHHESGGTLGLAVNRPSEVSLGQAFPDIEPLHGAKGSLFLGGPVSPRSVFVLVQSERPRAGMERVAEGIYFSQGLGPVLEDPPGALSGDSIRVFAGYAGWAPGQLEAEIERGDWIVAWEKPAVAFTRDPKKLWRKLLRSWSGRWT